MTVKTLGKCLLCKHPAVPSFAPFCSAHCKDMDLSNWLGGRYAIPGQALSTSNDNDEDSID